MTHIRLPEYKLSGDFEVSDEQFLELKKISYFSVETGSSRGKVRISSTSYVGSYFLDDLYITIEPKIGTVNFIKMLIQGDDEATPFEVNSLNTIEKNADDTIWDFLAKAICDQVEQILKSGVQHQYVESEDNLAFLRGQIFFEKNITENPVNQARVFCRYEEYSPNIIANKMIRWGLQTLLLCCSNKSTKHRLLHFDSYFSEIEVPSAPVTIDYASINGKYKRVLRLIELIQKNLSTTMGSGFSGHGFFIDMNKVFEGFVRNRLREAVSNLGILVPSKKDSSTKLCTHVGLEPDLLFVKEGLISHVLDCKYKENWNFLNTDVFQMLAYLEGFRSTKQAFVLYPCSGPTFQIEAVEYPRSGTLTKIGIPDMQLLDPIVWDRVAELILNRQFKKAV